jgi:hypothetical protein
MTDKELAAELARLRRDQLAALYDAEADPTKYPFVAPKPEELQDYIDAAITIEPIDPQAPVTYNGVSFTIEDLPTSGLRAMFGYGHPAPFSRAVILRTDGKQWPYTPNMCLLAGNPKGIWVDPQHLACPGCGLDMT